jgi:hypothetical protein
MKTARGFVAHTEVQLMTGAGAEEERRVLGVTPTVASFTMAPISRPPSSNR